MFVLLVTQTRGAKRNAAINAKRNFSFSPDADDDSDLDGDWSSCSDSVGSFLSSFSLCLTSYYSEPAENSNRVSDFL